jgi:glycine/D-amino acid oxidase-like deaminating enzyme
MTMNGHRTADIVIVGAGVMGASTAFHLALRKLTPDWNSSTSTIRE